MKRRLTAAAIVAAVSTVVLPGAAGAEPTYRVLDEVSVPGVHDLTGIDYRDGRFVAITGDSSRVYTAELPLTEDGFGRPTAVTSTKLREADGTGFPQGGSAVRVDPADGTLVWANPGQRDRNLDSTVQRSAADGTFVARYPAAPHTAITATEGIRRGIAGLTFNPTGTLVISAQAEPLVQDGDHTVRLSFANRTTGTVLSQLAYELDARRGNRLAEILAVDASHYLVLERTGLLYEATTIGARSVLPFASTVGATYTPVQKRLVADLSDLHLSLAGMTWGPTLPTGERTLVLVSAGDCTKLVAITLA